MGEMYYDRNGKPLAPGEWAELHGDAGYKRVALHFLHGWMISTVWLGLDHGFHNPAPMIFETMIFPPRNELAPGEDEWHERYCERHATEATAMAGHDQALAWLAELIGLPDAHDAMTLTEAIAAGEWPEGDG